MMDEIPYLELNNANFRVDITTALCGSRKYPYSPTEGIGNSGEEGGSQRPKYLKQCMKLNWNFRRGGGS